MDYYSMAVFVGDHGFTVPELVALSGAHTLGQAHCANFKNRLSGFGKAGKDPTMEAGMAASLAKTLLTGSPETAMCVTQFADSPYAFFETFVQGMGRMGQLDLSPDGNGRLS
ncbi:peroxidase 5-like [Aegilops tauschii subsp. strangulata]|uniref:peroxidase 5-like n=1 Tax=Aegilops tauschii subsp. strangulata TaxID=200361 RepID=UPI003CC871D2